MLLRGAEDVSRQKTEEVEKGHPPEYVRFRNTETAESASQTTERPCPAAQ